MVQLVEERTVGSTSGQPVVLPRTVPPSRSVTRFLVPVDLARRDSGVVLTNRLSLVIKTTLTLRDGGGATVGSVDVPVPAGGQVAISCRSLFPAADGQKRNSDWNGPSPIGAAVDAVGFLRRVNERGEEIVAGFPVLDGEPGARMSSRSSRSPSTSNSWHSEWSLWNATAAELVTKLLFHGVRTDDLTCPFE